MESDLRANNALLLRPGPVSVAWECRILVVNNAPLPKLSQALCAVLELLIATAIPTAFSSVINDRYRLPLPRIAAILQPTPNQINPTEKATANQS